MSIWKTPKGTALTIIQLKGKDYLQVAQRLVWFREEKPDWRILTEFISLSEGFAIAKAQIVNEQGCVMATAHKREDQSHFPDFMEKAEAGAIGRALAYCGYGTQFCADELDEGERIVDAPQDGKPKAEAANSLLYPAPYPEDLKGRDVYKFDTHELQRARESLFNWKTGKSKSSFKEVHQNCLTIIESLVESRRSNGAHQ